MKTHQVGRQGLTTSVEGLGTMGMTAVYGTPNDAESTDTIHRAIELGVTLFDTADMYGPFSREELLGRAVHDVRGPAAVQRPPRLRRSDAGVGRTGVTATDQYARARSSAA
jgi:aryl-alcohol dehydrogenase-like predicted oxidoreductase